MIDPKNRNNVRPLDGDSESAPATPQHNNAIVEDMYLVDNLRFLHGQVWVVQGVGGAGFRQCRVRAVQGVDGVGSAGCGQCRVRAVQGVDGAGCGWCRQCRV